MVRPLILFLSFACIATTWAASVVTSANAETGSADILAPSDIRELIRPTGQPRKFTQVEASKARALLEQRVAFSREAVVGRFDAETRSELVADASYPGGGYRRVNFIVEKFLKESSERDGDLVIQVPETIFALEDENYRQETFQNMQSLLADAKNYKDRHTNGQVTEDELEHFNQEWRAKVAKLKYAYAFVLRVRRGENFSISDDKFALFLGKVGDNLFAFPGNGIYPIGYGTFIDIVEQETNQKSDGK